MEMEYRPGHVLRERTSSGIIGWGLCVECATWCGVELGGCVPTRLLEPLGVLSVGQKSCVVGELCLSNHTPEVITHTIIWAD